ncbi:hypothetical protein RI367_002231 [Sorochytrium milnesiophthora]
MPRVGTSIGVMAAAGGGKHGQQQQPPLKYSSDLVNRKRLYKDSMQQASAQSASSRVLNNNSVASEIIQGSPSFPHTPHIFPEDGGAPSASDPSFRQRLAFYLDTTRSGRIWDLFDAVLSTAQCALYLWNTTFVRSEKTPTPLPMLNIWLEVGIASVMVLQYLAKLYIAPDTPQFLASNYSLLTLVSSVPVLVACSLALHDDNIYKSYMSAGNIIYAYPFRWARLNTTIGITIMPVKDPIFRLTAVTRKAIDVSCAVFFTITTVSAFIHITTYKTQKKATSTFYDVFYFTVMSSTSGLTTNIAADGWFTRALLLYIMIAGAFYIPTHLTELLSMIRSRSKYTAPYKSKSYHGHVLVCGNFAVTSMLEFLREFFCSDHGLETINTQVVILNPCEPSEELSTILSDPAYLSRVKYVKGSATSFRALEKVSARDAKACFILTSMFSAQDADEEEAESIMRALAIKKFDSRLPVYIESMSPNSQSHFDYLDMAISDHVLCVDELKLGILGQTCRLPGFVTLLSLLSTSITDESCEAMTQLAEQHDMAYLKPYIHGASQEIYSVHLSPEFAGLTFLRTAELIYAAYGACLIGIGVQVPPDMRAKLPPSHTLHIVLNPADHIIVGNEIGFLISTEVDTATCIERFHIVPERDIAGGGSSSSAAGESTADPRATSSNPELVPLLGSSSSSSAMLRRRNTSDSSGSGSERSGTSPSVLEHLSKGLQRLAGGGRISPRLLDDAPIHHGRHRKKKDDDHHRSGSEGSSGSVASGDQEDDDGAAAPHALHSDDDTHSQPDLVLSGHGGSGDSNGGKPSMTAKERARHAQLLRKVESADDIPDHLSPSAVIEDCIPSSVRDHVVLCTAATTFPRHLELFLSSLRGPHLAVVAPVVILCPAEPTEHERKKYARWENIHYVTGSPLLRKDLMKVGIERARRVVVLSSARSTSRTADAGAILTVLNIESLISENIFIVVEFVHRENMKYIGRADVLANLEDSFSQTILRSSFMSGHVFSQSLLDSLLAQTYYNPNLLAVLKRLIFAEKRTMLEVLMAEEARPGKKRSRPAAPGYDSQKQQLFTLAAQHTHLFQCLIGPSFIGKAYGELHQYLTRKHKALALALYRTVSKNGSLQSFTIVNPEADLVVKRDDKVFVLSQEKPAIL